jgi:hypothetical protein
VGEAAMQPRNYVAMQPRKKACSKCSGFLARNWNVLKLYRNTHLITSCHFLAMFQSKKHL